MDEWSYKKAITVMTYSSYYPVVVPMNLVFLPIHYLIYRMCKKADNMNTNEVLIFYQIILLPAGLV